MLLFWGAAASTLTVSLTESLKLSESATGKLGLNVSVSETLKLAESPTVRLSGLNVSLTESVKLADGPAQTSNTILNVFLTEALEVVDVDTLVVSGLHLHISLAESLTIGDSDPTAIRTPLEAAPDAEGLKLSTDGPWGWKGNEPAVVATARVELALGGSFRECVVSDEPLAWWRFAESAGLVIDSSGHGYHGTLFAPVTREQDPGIPEGGGAYAFAGGAAVLVGGTVPDISITGSIECWIKPTLTFEGQVVVCSRLNGAYLAIGSLVPYTYLGTGAPYIATGTLTADAWNHLVVTYGSGTVTFYINGVAAGAFATGAGAFQVDVFGSYIASTAPFFGSLDELVIYAETLSSDDIQRHYAAGFWTDVSADLIGASGIDLTFGIGGNGPTDRIADVGVCTFGLWNDAENSGGLEGYYSPQHVNCRDGFTYGILARVVFTYLEVDYPRFMGKIVAIDPQPGRGKEHRVTVTLNDLMADLVESDLRNVTLQIGETEAALLGTVLDAIPVGAQPLARAFDPGLDVNPYAFDNLGAGMTAYDPIAKLLISSLGYGYMGPTGTFRYENRQYRQIVSSSYVFDDDVLSDIVVPSDLTGQFNNVRAVFHPKTIDVLPTTVLWSQTGSPPTIEPGATIEFFGTYFNPVQTEQAIGGTDQQAVTAVTDYEAEDASNVDKTAMLTVVATPFASTVKWTVTNTDAAAVLLTKLQIRGKGLYDLSPQTVESSSAQPYGNRAITIDMPYQAAYETALGLAEYIRAQYENQGNQLKSLSFLANLSAEALIEALTVQIGDRITVSETVTGVSRADVFINSIHLRVSMGLLLDCELGVSPTAFFADAWIMDDPDRSLAGETTIFGYA